VTAPSVIPRRTHPARGAGAAGPRLWPRLGFSPFELFVARRYLWSRPRQSFIALISLISICGVIVGVWVLTTTLSAMNGFEYEVQSKIVGSNAHVIMLTRDPAGIGDYESLAARLARLPDVRGVAPMVYSKAMLAAGGRADGVVLKGVDFAREREVTEITRFITPEISGIDTAVRSGLPGMVLGFELALRLAVGVGDSVILSSPLRTVATPLGAVPVARRFEVVGIFHSGMYEYDASFCYVSIPSAQEFLDMDERVTGIEMKLADMFDASRVGREAELLLGPPYVANNWIDLNRNLFSWMKIEKFFMFLILLLIILVAAFNIASMLFMVVMDKKRDIGVLLSMGATSGAIMRIFILEGLIVAVIGTALGSLLGIATSYVIGRYEIVSLPGDVYFIDKLPIRMEALDFLVVAGAALLICVLATLYPSWRAGRMVPVDAIRYE
jgi:lipoprotein-releasing system permease protein